MSERKEYEWGGHEREWVSSPVRKEEENRGKPKMNMSIPTRNFWDQRQWSYLSKCSMVAPNLSSIFLNSQGWTSHDPLSTASVSVYTGFISPMSA